jgi:hypothetical protein
MRADPFGYHCRKLIDGMAKRPAELRGTIETQGRHQEPLNGLRVQTTFTKDLSCDPTRKDLVRFIESCLFKNAAVLLTYCPERVTSAVPICGFRLSWP